MRDFYDAVFKDLDDSIKTSALWMISSVTIQVQQDTVVVGKNKYPFPDHLTREAVIAKIHEKYVGYGIVVAENEVTMSLF